MMALAGHHAALAFAGVLLLAARFGREGRWQTVFERMLAGRAAAAMIGIATAAAIWWVWGASHPVPVVSDEASYLLQAHLFAAGRWAAPSPPLPEFFEQAHVLVVPRYASKYPPGHALALAPGVLLGLPALVPVIMSGLTGMLMFILARQVSNLWVALLAWQLWLSTRGNLMFRPSYLSEVTTGVLWLAGWWALLRWHMSGRPRWLVVLAACVGWGAITRPLTMLAFALPLGSVVLWKTWKSRRWRDLVAPLATVAVILAILPIWSAKVSGNWRQTPVGLYTASYIPWDTPGFGLQGTPATRRLPDDISRAFAEFVALHRSHTLHNLPGIAAERLIAIGAFLWGGWRIWILPLVLAGLFLSGAPGYIAVACGAALFLAYLPYAHLQVWVVYYLEAFPIVAFLGAVGLYGTASVVARVLPPRHVEGGTAPARVKVAVTLLLPLFSYCVLADLAAGRTWLQRRSAHQREFLERLAQLPDARSVVFVRYSPEHYVHDSHVFNDADLNRAPVWLLHDRGAENRALLQQVPDRVPYLYDESKGSLERMR